MRLDWEGAIVELTSEETIRWFNDAVFKARVIRNAEDMADETDRTVYVCSEESQEPLMTVGF